MTPTTDNDLTDLLRRAALENAIASGEMEGVVFTPAMRDLLERSSLGLVTEEGKRGQVHLLSGSTPRPRLVVQH